MSLKNAYLLDAVSLSSATFDAATVYNQWTKFPQNFNPIAAGLTLVISPAGDLDADDRLTAADIDMVANRIGQRGVEPSWLPDGAFDLNGDGSIDPLDHRVWVKQLAHTWYGDANLDGEFNSTDFVEVFIAGKYETDQDAGWAEGDWTGDGLFNSSDMVTAFVDGGYEQGLMRDTNAVPEPTSVLLLVAGLTGLTIFRRERR